MKKIIIVFMAAALLITGCSKNPPEDGGQVGGSGIRWSISMTDLPEEGVKTSWQSGDRIYVFFDDEGTKASADASSLPFLMLEWDGAKWDIDDSSIPEELPQEGTLTAIHCPFSSEGPSVVDGSFYVGNQASWCLYAMDVAYVSGGGQVRFSLDMTVPADMAAIHVPGEDFDGNSYALTACKEDLSAGLAPVSFSFNPATGDVAINEGNIGDDIVSFPVTDGWVFCGKAVSPVDGKMAFVLNEKDDEGNNLENVYTYMQTGLLSLSCVLDLPTVSSWVAPTSKITTVLYEDGTLVINELPDNHIANAIKHGAVLLTHGFIGNLVPSTTEQDPETGAMTTTVHLPWYSEIENDSSNEWQQKIRHIEFGSELVPSMMYKSFMNLGQLLSVDTKNLVIASKKENGERNFWRMTEAFKNCKVLRDIDVSGWDVSEVTSMDYAFDQCQKLQALDVSNWNVEKVGDMRGVFRQCQNVPVLNLSNWKTSNVKRMKEMFRGVFKVTELDLSGFDTSEVTDMAMMFYQCFALTTIFASEEFVTTAVNESDERLFYQCEKLVGGNGTMWSESNMGRSYARVDAVDTPGYFTKK